MTVRELIEQLQKEDPDRIVIMSKDAEGNNYSPLSADYSLSSYKDETTYSGYIGLERLTPELEKKGFSKDDVIDGKPAIVLYPIN